MKLKALGLTAVAVSAAALVAACGGGGDGATTADVQLSGVAATGLALASSPVDVKCAKGTGTATTNESGGYTVTVTDGALPCIVKVTGTVNGVEVTLHSLAQAGTTSGSTTTATANVTPLTEMILARAAGTLPSDLFANFGAGDAVSGETLTQASTDILAALSTAAGVDLTGIDPFKATLVAATPSNLSGGNDYDKLLDQLGTVVSTATLPQVVGQIASTTGSSAPVTLDEVVANVAKGTLAGCPQALSGKYRVLDYIGHLDMVDIDFGAKKLTPSGSSLALTIVPNPDQACEFSVEDSPNNVLTTVVMASSGAGAIADAERVGYMFPVQAHNISAVQGKWDFIESGINEDQQGEHWIGEMTMAADGKVTVCDYDLATPSFATCPVDTEEPASIKAGTDGGFVINYGSEAMPVYGFRAPNGSLTLFGTSNPSGSDSSGILKTHIVLSRPQATPRQSVGTVVKYWDLNQGYDGSTLTATLEPHQLTVTEASETSVTRTRAADGRVDTFQLDKPVVGLRERTATSTVSGVYNKFFPGLGIAFAVDSMPNAHFASISVNRP